LYKSAGILSIAGAFLLALPDRPLIQKPKLLESVQNVGLKLTNKQMGKFLERFTTFGYLI